MSAVIPDEHRPRVAFWALAAVALLISHDATFLVQVGPGEALARALREAGHGYWGAASVVLLLIGLAAGARLGIRLVIAPTAGTRPGARRLPPSSGPHGCARASTNWGRLLAPRQRSDSSSRRTSSTS